MALLLPLVVLALMWVFLILPQQRRVRAHRAFVEGLAVGDEVVTTAGVYGTVTALEDDTARLRIAPDVEITIARMAIGRPQVEPDDDEAPAPDADAGATGDPDVDDRSE